MKHKRRFVEDDIMARKFEEHKDIEEDDPFEDLDIEDDEEEFSLKIDEEEIFGIFDLDSKRGEERYKRGGYNRSNPK